MHFLGEITLNLSLVVYVVWLLPQIILNFKRKNTQGLSLLMHSILSLGYLSDLIYGFGLHMQWQYRLVTIVGLVSLAVQHYQFSYYGAQRLHVKRSYLALNILFLILLSYTVYTIIMTQHTKNFFDLAGMFTNVCWFSYMVPQIIKNYWRQSTTGLSITFVLLSIFLNICDTNSAWLLDWDYPSKLGAPLALLANLILLVQIRYYARASDPAATMVNNRQRSAITSS